MSDINLFRTSDGTIEELKRTSLRDEKELQKLIEQNLEPIFGICFLKTEYSFDGGRIDTLGIDKSFRPVIIEYKRTRNQNVTTQGLHYLAWLLDHKEAFQILVMKTFGVDQGDNINWPSPRLICVAAEFTRDDVQAIKLKSYYNIELIRYRRYGNDFLTLELVNGTTDLALGNSISVTFTKDSTKTPPHKALIGSLTEAAAETRNRFGEIKAILLSYGNDVQMGTGKLYFAFRRTKNFACVKIMPRTGQIVIWVKVNPDSVMLEQGFTRDMRGIGHHGTGDLEITVRSDADLGRAQPLLIESYKVS